MALLEKCTSRLMLMIASRLAYYSSPNWSASPIAHFERKRLHCTHKNIAVLRDISRIICRIGAWMSRTLLSYLMTMLKPHVDIPAKEGTWDGSTLALAAAMARVRLKAH